MTVYELRKALANVVNQNQDVVLLDSHPGINLGYKLPVKEIKQEDGRICIVSAI